MKTDYVLIDYENVQPDALSRLENEQCKVMVFVGASQAKVTFEAAAALQRMGRNAEYIKISGNGSNALDFHIAFYIGQLSAKEASAHFHIISRDTGFDPLIQHLSERGIQVSRTTDVGRIFRTKETSAAHGRKHGDRSAAATSPATKLDVVVADLKRRGASRPRTVKTLTSTIGALFQKQLQEGELAALLEELQAKGHVVVHGTKVSYS